MTFQRWARLLIGVLEEDDFIVSAVKANVGGESVCKRWSLLKLKKKKKVRYQSMMQEMCGHDQNCYLINKTLHWQVKYNQADLSF